MNKSLNLAANSCKHTQALYRYICNYYTMYYVVVALISILVQTCFLEQMVCAISCKTACTVALLHTHTDLLLSNFQCVIMYMYMCTGTIGDTCQVEMLCFALICICDSAQPAELPGR